MNLFAQITKVDAKSGIVHGRITQEVPDASQEIMDYQTSKPFFETWSKEASDATGGMSKGNVRAMHGKVAAGKLTEISFLDDDKAIDVVAKIVDLAEREKCIQGVYTGFSIGGKYEKRWQDGDNWRYTANPSEVSLVDSPCLKTARFTLVKADGSEEEHDLGKACPAELCGPTFADLEKYAGEEVYDAATAIGALSSIMYLFDKESVEKHPEAAQQLQNLSAVISNLKAFIASEIMEVQPTGGAPDMMMMAKAVMLIAKAGARNSKVDSGKVQDIHDHSVFLGADCAAAKVDKGEGESMEKLEMEQALAKADEKIAALEKNLGERDEKIGGLEKTLAEVTERLTKLEAQPAPGGPALKVVGKGEDVTPAKEQPNRSELIEKKDTLGLIKMAHGEPLRLGA